MEVPYKYITPIDYLVVGHTAQDLTSDGSYTLGGTVSYAAQTANILGLKPGIVTSVSTDADLSELKDVPIACKPTPQSTVFENRYTPRGRIQYIHNHAQDLTIKDVPDIWRSTTIIHLGPIAREVDANMVSSFEESFICLTPQGWLRQWDEKGLVSRSEWKDAITILPKVDAAVLSIEDVAGDWNYLEKWAEYTRVLVVTQGEQGATIFYKGVRVQLAAPQVRVVDPTGAGDVFAAAFFIRLFHSKDPIDAGHFAISIASSSIEALGLKGITDKY